MSPAATGQALSLNKLQAGDMILTFTLNCESIRETVFRSVFEISAVGRPMVMNVPIQLLNGNMKFELTEFRPGVAPVDIVLFEEV